MLQAPQRGRVWYLTGARSEFPGFVGTGAELRAEMPKDGGSPRIRGMAVPWESLSHVLWFDYETDKSVRERFHRGAFSGLLSKPGLDVVALRDHDPSRLLARTIASTLRLYETERGLEYDFDQPNTTDGRDCYELIRLGNLRGSSFAFTVERSGERWEETEDSWIRNIHEVSGLFDVSPVTYPAYPDSEADLATRSIDSAKESFEAWRRETAPPAEEREEARHVDDDKALEARLLAADL